MQQVKNFVQRPEVTQLYKKPTNIHNFIPITAQYKGEILQIDLVHVSNLSKANLKTEFLLTCIGVFHVFFG